MIYTPARCLFTFGRSGEISACPDCGSPNLRHSTDDEIAEYERNKAQSEGIWHDDRASRNECGQRKAREAGESDG